MRGIDAKFLYSETPTAHMHTLKVAVFDMSGVAGGYSYDEMVTMLADRLGRLPPFRQRAVPVPFGLGHPVLIEDPEFALERHVSRRRIEPPGEDRELAAVVFEVASRPLRRDRPLWELVMVEGLSGGRVAAVAKVHHALADGATTVQLLGRALEPRHPGVHPDAAGWAPEAIPSNRELLRLAAREHRRRLRMLPDLAVRSVRGMREAERIRRRSSMKAPLPFDGPRTLFNVSLTPERTFAMTTLDFEDVRAIRRALDVTVNDVFLGVCGGALRAFLDRRSELPAQPLVASVPVATETATEHLAGNHVDNLYVSIGTNIADPLERVRHIAEVATAAKVARRALGTDLFEERAEVVPPQLFALTVRAWTRTHLANHLRPPVNLVVSNVAGPPSRLEVDGAVLESLYSVGPILEGIGLNITAWSYAGKLHVSLLGCPASLPDPWPLADALGDSLAELRDAVGAPSSGNERAAPTAGA